MTKFRSNTNLQNELVTALEELSLILNAPVFKQHVRLSVVVQDAQKHRRDLFEFSPTAPVTNDYKNLINEYLAEEGEQWSGHPNYA